MKFSARLVAFALLLSLAGPLFADQFQFVANVSGTRKFQSQNQKGMNIIGSEAVNLKSICASFGVSPKDYALVFNVALSSLSLIPLSGASMLPTYEILVADSSLNTYNSAAPAQTLYCATLKAGGQAGGTEFSGMKGLETYTVKLKNGAESGALGTFAGVATVALPSYSFFQLRFTATKQFNQQ